MSKQLILLHGALGNKEQFNDLVPLLEETFDLHRLDFEGHGDTGPPGGPFRIEYFGENVLGYMDEHGIEKANIFGYSMGGYVALVLARDHPEKVKKVATLGTILEWDEEVAERECAFLYPQKIKEKVPHFARHLEKRHQHSWERVVYRTRDLLQHLGVNPVIKREDWKQYDQSIRFHIGDRDTSAGLEKTVEIYKKNNHAELSVLPGAGHPLEEIDPEILSNSLADFF